MQVRRAERWAVSAWPFRTTEFVGWRGCGASEGGLGWGSTSGGMASGGKLARVAAAVERRRRGGGSAPALGSGGGWQKRWQRGRVRSCEIAGCASRWERRARDPVTVSGRRESVRCDGRARPAGGGRGGGGLAPRWEAGRSDRGSDRRRGWLRRVRGSHGSQRRWRRCPPPNPEPEPTFPRHLAPANFLDIRMGSQLSFLERNARRVAPFSSGSSPASKSEIKRSAYFCGAEGGGGAWGGRKGAVSGGAANRRRGLANGDVFRWAPPGRWRGDASRPLLGQDQSWMRR